MSFNNRPPRVKVVFGNPGVPGLQGAQGVQGPAGGGGTGDGAQGIQGTQGLQGAQGLQGVQGISNQGVQGLQGRQGTQGIQGLQGSGSQGIQGVQGSGTQGAQGLQGGQGLQGLSGAFAGQGIQGIQGPAGGGGGGEGSQGIQGIQGVQGTQGIQGRQGAQGLQGIQGISNQGVQGLQGTQGIQGTSNQGVQGLQGTQGLQGIQGISNQGVQGLQGTQGLQGIQGISNQGVQGLQGRQGTQGIQGTSNQGVQGLQGTQGIQGISNQGVQGLQGTQGVQGTSIQGIQGPAGPAGTGSGTITVAANTALAFNTTTNVLSTIYNTSIADTVDSIAVGGASVANAATWKTKNIVEVLDTILFPDVLPTYTIPTISFSGTVVNGTTVEVGNTITQSLTANGTKNDANAFTQIIFRRGATVLHTNTSLSSTSVANVADQFGYTNPNNPNFRYTGTNTDIYVVTAGSTSWDAVGSYGTGLAKKNNKGVTDTRTPAVRSTNAPQAASSDLQTTPPISITGIYPYFWGISSTEPNTSYVKAEIENATANKVLADSSGTITITFNGTDKFIWFAHIATSTSKVWWYNSDQNQGSIGEASSFIRAPQTQSVNSASGFWTNQSYKVYISDYATNTTSGPYQFRNTAP